MSPPPKWQTAILDGESYVPMSEVDERDRQIDRLVILLERQIAAWRSVDRPMIASNLAHELALARNPEARSVPDDPQEAPA